MKKNILLILISCFLLACQNQSVLKESSSAEPLVSKRGDNYIFINRVEHKQNSKYLLEYKKDQIRFIIKVRTEDIEKVEIVLNEEEMDMKLIGNIDYDEYYYIETEFKENIKYYFKLKDNKTVWYFGNNETKDLTKIEKFEFEKKENSIENYPRWSKEVLWYEIFIDRFRNGNKENDPIFSELGSEFYSQSSGVLSGGTPKNYLISGAKWDKLDEGLKIGEFTLNDWGSDWNKKEEWEKKLEEKHNIKSKNLRFYGGDIQGIIEKLDYIKEKGFSAIQLSPVFYSKSNHKYDTADYRHVSPELGVIEQTGETYGIEVNGKMYLEEGKSEYKLLENEKKDINNMGETEDVSTWVWTESDMLFTKLIQEAHLRGIRIVCDINFTSTSNEFWAFEQALRYGPKSRYSKWYKFKDWEKVKKADESNVEIWNPLVKYNGKSLVSVIEKKGQKYRRKWLETKQNYSIEEKNEIYQWNKLNVDYIGKNDYREIPLLNYENEELKKHLIEMTKRWILGPDEKISENWMEDDGLDGFNIELGNEIKEEDFFIKLREVSKNLKKDFLLISEIWKNAFEYREKLAYDTIKNYEIGDYISRFVLGIGNTKMKISEFKTLSTLLMMEYRDEEYKGSQTLIDSHDTDRLFSMIINTGREYDVNNDLEDKKYFGIRPDLYKEEYLLNLKLITLIQMTCLGAPVVYYGDELGMWGADDPNNRKPMLWDDIEYEKESDSLEKYKSINKTFGEEVETDEANAVIRYEVKTNEEIIKWYKQIIEIRNKYKNVFGNGDLEYLLVDDEKNIMVYKREYQGEKILIAINRSNKIEKIELELKGKGKYTDLFTDKKYDIIDGKVIIELEKNTGTILYMKKG